MAGQVNLQRVVERFSVISANTTAIALWTYHITTASTITLPNPATLAVGDWVKFTKKIGVIPTIQRNNTELIKTVRESDTTVFFDIEAEIIFVWDGMEWEV
jgi:hypothetical protein